MPQPQTYYRDDSESNVKGIIVIETGDEGIRVTENREDSWWSAPFWMPEGEFNAATHPDSVQQVGELPDSKFNEVISVAYHNA